VTDGIRPHPQSPTILLVEDEPAIRSLIRRMLEGAGYELLIARNGNEALTVAKQHRGVIDLLLTDIVMPRMNGFELGEQIGSARPETNVLFVSGFFKDSTAVRSGLRATGRAFLLKPFTQDALLGKIQEVLQS
jgi:CheY-like chemotaxis protein|tara:strand:- start:55 stop:453 length:399 start_codon:yes stop_codon:yes gene_type:complete